MRDNPWKYAKRWRRRRQWNCRLLGSSPFAKLQSCWFKNLAKHEESLSSRAIGGLIRFDDHVFESSRTVCATVLSEQRRFFQRDCWRCRLHWCSACVETSFSYNQDFAHLGKMLTLGVSTDMHLLFFWCQGRISIKISLTRVPVGCLRCHVF